MQGTEIYASNGRFRITATSTINYINIPIMAKFYVLKKLSLQVGPQIGFVVSAEDELVSNVPSLQSSTRDVTTDYKTIDYGLNFGIGLNLTKKLFADVRYSIGLDQIVKELPALSDGGKNRVFSLNLGYAF